MGKLKKTFLIIGLIAVVLTSTIVIILNAGGLNTKGAASGNLKIMKSELSETVIFYPYKAGGISMEVLAVKADDGTIRTAFNTCQVCYDSGRGYYKQHSDELVCQNCGNRFKINQIEKLRGGCNPVPILNENKTEDETSIVILKAFLEENKGLFGNWKR